jgi:hypothetical protein
MSNRDAMQARFDAFHADHPQVWKLFLRFVKEAMVSGRRKFGARMIWERMRWFSTIETKGDDFKLNDHYPPFYARLFMETYPQYAGFFEIREKATCDGGAE